MNNDIIRIPIDKSKFNDEKVVKAQKFLNDFFNSDYKCSFVCDEDGVFCLEIAKNSTN